MEFGVLFTSHPNHVTEPYPHRDVHARVTAEIQAADRLGYDSAWVAEHHFSNQYGIMPDVFEDEVDRLLLDIPPAVYGR